MAGAVQFNYTLWVDRYPEFSTVKEPLAKLYFSEASIYCANTLTVIGDIDVLTVLLYMMTSHIAFLNAPQADGTPASPLVGRITNASQGSVSVAVEMPNQPQAAAWYQQSKYGAAFWAASAPYRTMRYLPGLQRSRRAASPQPFGVFRRWSS